MKIMEHIYTIRKKYLPSELYEEIKPKYELYKHIDGKEFHNYYNNNLIYY